MSKTFKDNKPFSAHERIQVPPDTSICFVGDIHEHSEQFFKLLDKYKPGPKKWLVSVGDVWDKGYGRKAAEDITDELAHLQKDGIGWAIRGNHEIKLIKKTRKSDDKLSKQLKWWAKQPLVITFEFPRGALVTTLHAGVTPKMTMVSLKTDIEVVYVRDVDENGKMIPLIWKVNEEGEKILVKSKEGGKSWHELYDGRFGYIVSGHVAQKDGTPSFYNHSANIDTGVYESGILTGQVFDSNGRRSELIQVEGTPFKPNIAGE
jgi:predicted MPP superfamily phosphohydrolase